MKNLCLFLIVSLSSLGVRANNIEDSLLQILAQPDVEYIDSLGTYFDLSDYLDQYDLEKSNFYANKGKQIAEKKGDQKGIAGAYVKMGGNNAMMGKPSKSLALLDSAYKYFGQAGDSDLMANALINKALILQNFSLDSNSFDLYRQALDLTISLDSSVYLADAYSGLSRHYDLIGDYSKAAEQALLGLEQANRMDDDYSRGVAYMDLTSIFLHAESFDDALEYARKFEAYSQKMNNYSARYNAAKYISMIYGRLSEQKDSAEHYANEAYRFAARGQNIRLMAEILEHLASYAREKRDYDLALKYVDKGIEMNRQISQDYGLMHALNQKAKILNERRNFNIARKYVDSAMALSDRLSSMQFKEGILKNAIDIYKNLRDYERAVALHEDLAKIKNELHEAAVDKQYKRIETAYKVKEKDHKILALSQEKELESLRAERRTRLLVTFGIIGLCLFFGSFLWQRLRTARINRELVEMEQRLLRTQMNPHFISNCMAVIQNMVMNKKPIEATKLLGKFGNLTRQILHSSREEYIPLEQELSLLKDYLTFQQLSYPEKFDFEFAVNENINHEEVKIPPMLIQPFIENAIEHGIKPLKEKGKISVSFTLDNNDVLVKIIDNGVGFETKKSIATETKRKSYSTEITKERLALIQSKLKRKIEFVINDLDELKGTEVQLKLPYSLS
ncbi:MAG: histidine kinase [Flavobacteriales bacterium]|nr:histidine kinase [Flavobacteriales bacterium]